MTGVLGLERSQLNGDLLTGGGGGCGAAGGTVGIEGGGSETESFLGGSAGGTPLEVVVEFWELVDDLENRFVNDSTIDVGDVDIAEASAAAGTASFGGGSSSMRDTSSREEVDMRR